MKKAICVNVDIDVLIAAKQKVDNISEYCNECLKGLIGKSNIELKESDIKEQIENINNSMQELAIKKSILEMDVKRLKEEIIEKKKELKDREQFQRWTCPVCKTNNFMDNISCSKCNLKTRNDKKTVITFINEVGE
jgi:transposase-like protein